VQTITWTADAEKPTVTGTASITISTCNPADPTSSFVAPTAADNCGAPTIKTGYPETGAVTTGANCTNTQTRTWVYVDACGNESNPFVQTITWTTDAEKPTVTGTASITIPGCNPADPTSFFVTPTANDNCGAPVIKTGYPQDGAVTANPNATKSQTRTWIFVDACGNESTPFVQTITWAICPPVITGTTDVCAGLTTQLTGSGTPAASNPWVSSSPGVATVNSSGLVTGISVGTSTITYTDSNEGTQTVTITVNPKPTPIITHN
jgi:hypothetical protein